MAAPRKYSEELRERAVRLVFESGRPIAHVVPKSLDRNLSTTALCFIYNSQTGTLFEIP